MIPSSTVLLDVGRHRPGAENLFQQPASVATLTERSFVMPGLVPGIQLTAYSGARFELDPGNKCRDDMERSVGGRPLVSLRMPAAATPPLAGRLAGTGPPCVARPPSWPGRQCRPARAPAAAPPAAAPRASPSRPCRPACGRVAGAPCPWSGP